MVMKVLRQDLPPKVHYILNFENLFIHIFYSLDLRIDPLYVGYSA